MWNGTMFVDLNWPLNASSLLSASAELLVTFVPVTEKLSFPLGYYFLACVIFLETASLSHYVKLTEICR